MRAVQKIAQIFPAMINRRILYRCVLWTGGVTFVTAEPRGEPIRVR